MARRSMGQGRALPHRAGSDIVLRKFYANLLKNTSNMKGLLPERLGSDWVKRGFVRAGRLWQIGWRRKTGKALHYDHPGC